MVKNIICTVCICMSSFAFSGPSDFITYEWLLDTASATAYTDHISHFRHLFKTMKVRCFFECGCGYSTKYFLDHCDQVISVEFLTPGNDDMWFRECLRLYADYNNWIPLRYNADHLSESFNKACGYQCSIHKDYALIDSKYLGELDQFFKEQIEQMHQLDSEIDVAFVDPGVYTRGDMVKVLLANQIPIVVAHDTATDVGPNVDEGLYGWFKVKAHPDYEKIYIPFGQGTTFWISKNRRDVIDSMTKYRDFIIERSLSGTLNYEAIAEFTEFSSQ